MNGKCKEDIPKEYNREKRKKPTTTLEPHSSLVFNECKEGKKASHFYIKITSMHITYLELRYRVSIENSVWLGMV